MTRTINISLNVPDFYQMEELTRQLTEYGEHLIARRKTAGKPQRPSMDFLKDFTLPKGTTQKQLVGDYLKEKYSL